jgi:pantetheine-phosphate adenylyltransferase
MISEYLVYIAEQTGKDYALISSVADRYHEEHRVYHNIDHLIDLFKMIEESQAMISPVEVTKYLTLALYHDAIYDPNSYANEDNSADLYLKHFGEKDDIYQAILDTKYDRPYVSPLSDYFTKLDLKILTKSLSELIRYEKKIFKEFQFADWTLYKRERIKLLKKLIERIEPLYSSHKLNELIEYVETYVPKIGVYAGSFNPFHVGHLDVLHKAEKIFDKVIIAKGSNIKKEGQIWFDIPRCLKHRQVEDYKGYLTDFLNGLDYDTTLIRGIRDFTDLEYEKKFNFYCKVMKHDFNMINILTEPEFQNISSSAILQLPEQNQKKFIVE